MSNGKNNRFEASSVSIEGDKPMSIDEISALNDGKGIEVEVVTGLNASDDVVALEAFMNEIVYITIPSTGDEEELTVVSVGVNGVNQPIVRDVSTPVKRKYVEVLARAKETKYKQMQMDANDPASLVMVPKTALAHNFTVERDDNPKGRAWLREVLKQPA
jgi:hypothetical protein